jgi:hypothetical protein
MRREPSILLVFLAAIVGCSDDPPDPFTLVADQGIEAGRQDMLPVPDGGLDAAPRDLGADRGPACDPSPERCNERDDDCDGQVDEGFDLGAPCGFGIGACRVVAALVCGEDLTPTCPIEAGQPGAEACNGLDDDCDGRTDEDFDGDGDGAPVCPQDPCAEPCPEGEDDRCRALCDAQDCRDENLGVYPQAADPCGDGIDQNCDGFDAPCSRAIGRLASFGIAMANAATCPDVNGDGTPDNAMALLGGVANGPLGDAVAEGSLNLFLIAAGLAPPGTEGAFELGFVTGEASEGSYRVDPEALDDRFRPRIRFEGARVRGGMLRAGPGRFELGLPVGGLDLRLVLFGALVQGNLSVSDDFGLTLTEGLIWGAVREVDLNATLDGLEQVCQATEPAPDYCGPLRQFRPLLANVLRKDQDTDGDGTLDAFSICTQTTAAPAVLQGLDP